MAVAVAAVAVPVSSGEADAPVPLVEVEVGGGKDHDAWHVGALFSRTGEERTIGNAALEGITQYLTRINQEGGFRDRKFRLFVADDQSTERGAVAGAWTFVHDDRFLAVIGPQTSDLAHAVIEGVLRRTSKVVFLSPTATRDGLVRRDGWLFSGLWPDSAQAQVMAAYLSRDLGKRRGTVVVEPHSLYSVGLAAHFREAFQGVGGTVAQVRIDSANRSELPQEAFPPILTAIKETRPEFIYAPLTTGNVRSFVRQAFRSGVDASVTICGGDTWDSADTFQSAGRRLEGCLLTSPFYANDPDERVRAYTRRMNLANVPMISLDTVMGRDIMAMMIEAMDKGAPTREGIREGWFKIRDLPLVSGDTTIDENGLPKKPILLLKVATHPTGYLTELVKRMNME